jgi:hypothetical protein
MSAKKLSELQKGSKVKLEYTEKFTGSSVVTTIHEVDDKYLCILTNCGNKRWFSKETGYEKGKSYCNISPYNNKG